MTQTRQLLAIAMGPALAGLISMSALAQQGTAPPTGTTATSTGSTASTAAPAQASSDRRLSELFYQLQVLQQEVQELRGLVEEQAYHLNRLARDQKEQYIDLDRRVAGLTTGTAAPGTAAAGGITASRPPAGQTAPTTAAGGGLTVPPPAGAPPGPTAGASVGSVATVPSGAGGVGEREAYQQAFDLMKGRKFEESIASFNSLIVNFPNGQYTPNAFYWLGELYLAQQDTEQARQSFMQVISLYPDHPKVPDTLYKLGIAYHRLGDTTRAMDYFGQVQSRYPQSSAAGLAASYAQEIR